MFRGIARIVTHASAGAVWCVVALGLAAALVSTQVQSHRKEDFLRARIAALATHDASQLQAELVSCQANVRAYAGALQVARGGEPRPGQTTEVKAMRGSPNQIAAQLAGASPAGFDVCARMESADRAVMKTLDRR